MATPCNDEGLNEAGAGTCVGCGAPTAGRREQCNECRFMPSPWAAAVAVMGMLTLGVLLGSASSQIARSAGLTSILLEAPAAPAPAHEPVPAASVEPGAPPAPAPLPVTAQSSLPVEPPLPEAPAPAAPEAPTMPPEIPEEEVLPPIKHVFLIVLEEAGFEESFGADSAATYLAQTLPEKGELVSNYYAVAAGDLANQIALLSGQGPTPETAAGCPVYADVVPGTLAATGQVEGAGCIYPTPTPTLPGQLLERKLSWKAYVEDLAEACVHEEGRRNPVVYFRSLLDSPDCGDSNVALDQLALDLKAAATTPALSYIVPNSCREGGAAPCEPGQALGPLASDEFLQRVVPAIEASPAYKEGGLIAIAASQAPQGGAEVDASACCLVPEYPNLPPAAPAEPGVGPVKPSGGGGRVGLLLLSPFVAPGTVNESGYYNHYSLLRSIEELFGLEPLGYASEPALSGFDSSIYNYETSMPRSGAFRRGPGLALADPEALVQAPQRRRRPPVPLAQQLHQRGH